MDGKLLVLCDERPTINSYRERIDENGDVLRKENGKYYNVNNQEVDIDEHKEIISGMELLNNINTPAINDSDILFVDWNTVVSSNIELLTEMKRLSENQETIIFKDILTNGKNESITEKAYYDILFEIDRISNRPCIDYI